MNIAIIFAGGVGKRMQTNGLPKQFLEIDDKPILVHTLLHFQNNPQIDKIVIVMVSSYIDHTWELVKKYDLNKVCSVVEGGSTGQESIYHGLVEAEKVSAGDENSIVLIHDGVRPIIDKDLIDRNIASVKQYGSAISSAICNETIITIDDEGGIKDVPERSKSFMARAPQSFYLKDIISLHRKCIEMGKNNVIDSCTMMHDFGKKVHIVSTITQNIKVTNPEDYYLAESIIKMNNGTMKKV